VKLKMRSGSVNYHQSPLSFAQSDFRIDLQNQGPATLVRDDFDSEVILLPVKTFGSETFRDFVYVLLAENRHVLVPFFV
jgi:hypothetical protein